MAFEDNCRRRREYVTPEKVTVWLFIILEIFRAHLQMEHTVRFVGWQKVVSIWIRDSEEVWNILFKNFLNCREGEHILRYMGVPATSLRALVRNVVRLLPVPAYISCDILGILDVSLRSKRACTGKYDLGMICKAPAGNNTAWNLADQALENDISPHQGSAFFLQHYWSVYEIIFVPIVFCRHSLQCSAKISLAVIDKQRPFLISKSTSGRWVL